MSDLFDKMRANPALNGKIADIENRCRAFGVACNPPPGGGSRYKIAHRSQFYVLTIPSRRPIKNVYIRKLVRYIDAVRKADDRA